MKNIKIKFDYLTIYFLLIALLCGFFKKVVIILFIIIMHEIGHIITTYLLGYSIISITIYPFGGVSIIDKRLNSRVLDDMLISISGAIMQLVLMLFIRNSLFIKYNLLIIIFNMIPIIPLDGSKILFEIYNLLFSYKKSIKLLYITSFITIIIYLLLNIKYNLDNFLIVGLFIYKGIEYIKNKHILFNKFILERKIYDDIYYSHVDKNKLIKDYKKEYRYYYFKKGKLIDEKDYLNNNY